jgi:hypothetical protein
MTQLTEFQYNSLRDAANGELNTYMLVKPNAALDPVEQFELWTRNNQETEQLCQMGLLEDVSTSFAQNIQAHAHMTGRLFRVFKITEIGKAMFDEANTCSSVN